MPARKKPKRILPNNVRRFRHARAWTAEEVADRCGIDCWHVYKIERGTLEPGVVLALRIAKFFRVSVEDLFGEALK